MKRKERRTTEDYEGTEACGFMDVVQSWLLVKFNTTHLRWRACCFWPQVGWALVGQAYGCSSPGSPVEEIWPACSCSFLRRTPEVLESYGGFHSHFLMRDRKALDTTEPNWVHQTFTMAPNLSKLHFTLSPTPECIISTVIYCEASIQACLQLSTRFQWAFTTCSH